MKPTGAVVHTRAGRFGELVSTFLKLGCVSFGGPVAHLGFLHREVVVKRAWLDDAHYTDLMALCQFLPGPASSQMVFALGMQRAGFWGACIASFCFTAPSAALMIAFAHGVRHLDVGRAGWIHGLKLAAVAVVAQAVWAMGKKLCVDRTRVTLCVVAAAVLLVCSSALVQLGVIAAGCAVGYWTRCEAPSSGAELPSTNTSAVAWGALGLFAALLLALPMVAAETSVWQLDTFDAFYRSGALVFGGGHVVLPLLRAEIVPRGWLTDDQFLAGYGMVQAMPGPLFTFSAYLGAAMVKGGDWLNGVWCLFALFLPGWLLIGGALPFWHRLRGLGWAKGMLTGANAAVVGVLLAALYDPVFTEGVHGAADLALVLIAFALLEHWKLPSWLIVAGAATVGHWLT